MIEKTISEIEAKIRGAQSVSDGRKEELLQLLGQLKTEVSVLSRTHEPQAHAIASLTQTSANAATEANHQLRDESANNLRSSVEEFEQSHPKLVQVVNRISQTLADLGI